MFAFVLGYNYFSKPATIEKYLEENGGEEVYGSMQVDELTTAKITAKGNSMTVEMTIDDSNKEAAELAKEYYTGENGEKGFNHYLQGKPLYDYAWYMACLRRHGMEEFEGF